MPYPALKITKYMQSFWINSKQQTLIAFSLMEWTVCWLRILPHFVTVVMWTSESPEVAINQLSNHVWRKVAYKFIWDSVWRKTREGENFWEI